MDAVPTLNPVQRALQNRGFEPGPIDGVLGPQTEAAVRDFQDRYGIKASDRQPVALRARRGGIIGPAVAQPLIIAANAGPPALRARVAAVGPPICPERRRLR